MELIEKNDYNNYINKINDFFSTSIITATTGKHVSNNFKDYLSSFYKIYKTLPIDSASVEFEPGSVITKKIIVQLSTDAEKGINGTLTCESCTDTCTTNCSIYCDTCTTNCDSECNQACGWSSCWYECSSGGYGCTWGDACATNCGNCGYSCSNNCSGGCRNSCGRECTGSCKSGCVQSCYTSCISGCQDSSRLGALK